MKEFSQDIENFKLFENNYNIINNNSNTNNIINPIFDNSNLIRNLSFPISAQSKEKREIILNKYIDEKSNKFPSHYAVHYSTSGFLYYYLIRLPPFTENSIKFQGMRFDHPNRIFNSFKEIIKTLERGNDNRELIPEIFSLPETFLNANCYILGKNTNTNKPLDDFELPEYAQNNPIYMIFLQRNFLEDKISSDGLTYWIDNIFGDNQLRKTKDSLNLFKKFSYAQETNLGEKYENYKKLFSENEIAEEKIHKKISKILNFGQVPVKIFDIKHPKKNLTIKKNQYEKVFVNLLDFEIKNKKPVRYMCYSKTNILIIYFDNEVEIIKINEFEKNFKFQIKSPTNLYTYSYNFYSIKKRLDEEAEKYNNEKVILRKELIFYKEKIEKLDYSRPRSNSYSSKYVEELNKISEKLTNYEKDDFLKSNFSFYHYYKFLENKKEDIKNYNFTNNNFKLSKLSTENIIRTIYIKKTNNTLLEYENEKNLNLNEKITISIYKEKYFLLQFFDCSYFVSCQYLDNSIKVNIGETENKEFLMEDVKIKL